MNDTTTNARIGTGVRSKSDREKKIGHRRVGEAGEITYKKIQTSTIMGSIQLGIQHTVCITLAKAINWLYEECNPQINYILNLTSF